MANTVNLMVRWVNSRTCFPMVTYLRPLLLVPRRTSSKDMVNSLNKVMVSSNSSSSRDKQTLGLASVLGNSYGLIGTRRAWSGKRMRVQ